MNILLVNIVKFLVFWFVVVVLSLLLFGALAFAFRGVAVQMAPASCNKIMLVQIKSFNSN